MTVTVLKLSDADTYLKNISIKNIKDVRALDVDLMLVLRNGDSIIISNGAVSAMSAPESSLQFADGKLPLASVFQQIEKIDVSPEANLTVSSKEITRYNQNNARNKKARKDDEEAADKPVVIDDGEHDPRAAAQTSGSGGNTEQTNFTPTKSPDNQSQIADAEINSQHEKNWGVQWPIAAGALALLAAAGGGGGGGGGSNGGSAANGSSGGTGAGGGAAATASGGGAGTVDPSAAVIRGSAALGAIKNANVTAYDAFGNALSDTVAVIDGKYTLTLKRALYKGPMMLVVRDNTPGLADNYIDEATLQPTDLGNMPLRNLVMASGVNQNLNVTALTELAVLKAGLDQGLIGIANQPEITTERIIAANNAVSGFFKVDILATDVVATSATHATGRGIPNPGFTAALSVETQNYGAALKAIANLVRLDKNTYPNQASALTRLADSLDFVDEAGSGLKWATNTRGQTLAKASALQGALLSEPLTQVIDHPDSSDEAVETAQRTLDALQNLPNGSTVADYLINNHVAIPNPIITIRNAVLGNPLPWQTAPLNSTLVLDQGDLLDGDLRVRTTPNAKVAVIIKALDNLGHEISVSLPMAHADAGGIAILKASDENMEVLQGVDRNRAISAQVTVTDGSNSRTNHALWSSSNIDVRVDLNTPESMTRFAEQNPLSLLNDTFYDGSAVGDSGRFPAANQGGSDRITHDSRLRIVLNKAYNPDSERVQWAIATGPDRHGNPAWDNWREVNGLTEKGSPAPGRVVYETGEVSEVNGPIWVKVRIVQKGIEFTGGYGNANTLETPLQFTLDKLAPTQVRLRLVAGLDDGVASDDGITGQLNSRLELAAPREGGTELHVQLQTGDGSTNDTLAAVNTAGVGPAGVGRAIAPGSWITLKTDEHLVMRGDTKTGNGKVALKLRHIDAAGNYKEFSQTFVTDSTGTIELVNLLVQRQNVLKDASAARLQAKTAFDNATATEHSAKQALLAAALQVEEAARKAHEEAVVSVRKALTTARADGSYRLDDVLGESTDVAYLPAIVNQLSRATNVEGINHQAGLKDFVAKAKQKADTAVTKASVYGDDPANPAPDSEDFFAMGVLGLNNSVAMAAVVDAIKKLPKDKTNSITKIQKVTDAYLKVLALANEQIDTADDKLPDSTVYETLGVEPKLSPAAATILGNVLDSKKTQDVDTVAKLSAIAEAAQRIAVQAANSAATTPPTVEDFKKLGIDGVTADNLKDVRDSLNNVPPALRDNSRPDKVVGTVDTLKEVRAIVDYHIGDLRVLINYANGKSPIDPTAPLQMEPVVDNYRLPTSLGLTSAVTLLNLASINSALRAVGGPNVDSWKKVADLAASYELILSSANGIAGDASSLPTLDDFVRVGVKALTDVFKAAGGLDTAGQASAARLLAEVIDGSARSKVATVPLLETLADIAARAVHLAKQGDTVLSAAELKQLLNVDLYDDAQMAIIRSGITGTKDDGTKVNSVQGLKDVIDKALAAAAKIRAYADDASKTPPAVDDYRDLGIAGIDSALKAAALNSSLATDKINGAAVTSPAALQTIADAYLRILGEAGDVANANPDPLPADYTAIGVDVSLTANAGQLLNSVLNRKTAEEVGTVNKVTLLAQAAADLHALAKGMPEAEDAVALTTAQLTAIKTQLTKLGVNAADDAVLPAVIAALRLSPAEGEKINTLDKLQLLADKAADAQRKISLYADDASKPEPVSSDYSDMGVDKVTASNLDAINSALATPVVESAQTASPKLVQGIVTSYVRILAAADGVAGNATTPASAPTAPTAVDYERVGIKTELVTKLKEGDYPLLALLNTLVDATSKDKVNTVALLQERTEIADKIIAQVRGEPGDSKVSLQELEKVGITGLQADTFSAVLSALAASKDDGSEVIGQISGTLRLQQLANKAHAAMRVLENYADNKQDVPEPTSDTYKDVGLDLSKHLPLAGSAANAVSALNSALHTTAVTKAQVNPPTKLKEIIDSYQKVLAAANGAAPADGSLSPEATQVTAEGLGKLGITGLAGASEELLANVQAVVDGMAREKALEVANLQKTVEIVSRISRLADGTAGNASDADKFTDAIAELEAVGITVTDPVVAQAAVSAIDAVRFSDINSPKKLRALVEAYERILQEANENPRAAGAPPEDKQADATPTADPDVEHFRAIGVKVTGVTETPVSPQDQAARLRLLDDALKYRTRSEVDTVGKLTNLGKAVDAFMTLAAQAAGSTTSVTAEQWQAHAHALGIAGIDTNTEDGNLNEVLAAIRNKGVNTIDSISKLRDIVQKVNASVEVIAAYAESNTNPAPTVENYTLAGIVTATGVPLVTNDNLAAINSAIDKLNRNDVSTRRSIKAVVNAYNAILTAADGEAFNDSGATLPALGYLTIGVPLGSTAIGMGTLVVRPDGSKNLENVDLAKLALFNNVVGSRNKPDVSTPDKLEALAKTVADLIRTGREQENDAVVNAGGTALSIESLRKLGLSGIDTPVRRTAFLNAIKYKGNGVDTATGEPKTGDADSHKVDGIDTLAKLKRIAASYKTILDHVGAGESATAPTREDYLNIGVQLPAHGGQHALQLFNSAIAAQASDSNIDDISKLNKLALTVDKLMQIAAVTTVAEKYPDQYPEVAITLEADALTKLGLKRMNEASVALLLAKLQTTADDGSGAVRIQALQKMADDAVAAQARIFNYAETNTGTAPTVADFDALGLALPRNQQGEPTPYLNAINDALRSQSIDGSKADTPPQLQKLITAAQHVVDAANGTPNDATPKPNEADFLALGLDPQKIRDAKATGIAFLADTVDASTIDQLTKDSSGAPIALPDRLAQLLDLIQSLINTVAGRPANPPLSQETLSQLGVKFDNLHSDTTDKLTNWPAIRAAIAGSKADGSEVNSLIKLRGVVEKADTSQEILRQYAQANSGTAPTVEDYKNIGLVRIPADPDAVRSPLVSTDNVAAINAALRTVKVTAANADTPEHLKEVVDAYLAILARANGPAADTGTALTPDHFKRIGADITGVTDDSTSSTNTAVRSLLDSVIGSKLPANVDTPAKIERLGVLVNKVIAQASTRPGDTQPDQITAAELAELGITAPEGSLIDAANAPAVRAALYLIRFGDDKGIEVDTMAELQEVVRKAMTAYKKIQTYAALNDIPAGFTNDADRPNADDFEAMGLVAPPSVKTDQAAGAAASLATAHIGVTDIDTPEKLLTLLENWDKLLTLPDGQPNQPLAAAARNDFKTLLSAVGAPVAAGTSDAALDLLHSALDVMGNTAHMNTPGKLLALLRTTQVITDLAGHPQALSAGALPVGLYAAELIKLGLLPEAATSTNGAAASVLGAIAAQASPAEVDNMAELRPLATLALAAHARIIAYADSATAPAPTAADYTAIGLVKSDAARTPLVTADNLAALNSALASAPINAVRADDPSLLKAIIDAYQSIIDWHNGAPTVPVSGDYEAIGVTGLNPNAKTLLDGGVRKLPLENVKLQANLQKAADVAAHIVTLADGTANSDDNSLPLADDYAALGLDMGHSSRALDADGSGAALLGSVLDRKSWTDINSLDKLQTLADTVNKLMDKAATRTAPLPTADDLKALGVDISGKTPAQQEAILAAVGTSGTDGQAIKSVALLIQLADKAIAALAKIEAYAGSNTGDVPTAEDYKAMGVADVDANNLAAVNAALASVKVGAPGADTQPEVQAIVNAYRKILAAADGVRESVDPVGTDLVPTAAELERIGVTLAPNTPPSQLSLLATALDAVARNKVDTPAKIEIINASAARLIGAAGHAASADALQLSDFENLGVNGLSEDVMTSVRGLISTSVVESINTSTRLQTAIDGLLKDLKLIRNYADNKPNEDGTLGTIGVVLEPAVHNYANAGVQHVNAANLVSMNAAVKAQGNGQKVDSKLKLQAIADAYNHILQAADGVAGNVAAPVTRAELVTIGLADNVLPDPDKADSTPPQKALARATLGLLLTALDAQPADGSTVKTPALIADLLTLAGKVAQFTATSTATAPTLADLEKLGVRHLLAQQGPIPSTLLLVNDALGRTPADALNALDLGKVQTIATAAYKLRMLTTTAGVVADNLRPAADARDVTTGLPTTGAPLTRAELLALGMQIEDKPANIKLLNEALDNQPSFGAVSDVSKLNALNLADIVNRVMKLAAPDLAAPAVIITTAEWAKLGITSTGTGAVVNGDSLAAFEAALKLHQPADMDTLAELRELASAAHTALNKIRDYAQSAADGVVAPANSAGLPTLQDFKAIGVTGVERFASITPDRPDQLPEGLFALLSSLASAAISGAEAATHTQIQQIVDSYNKVLALADGTANLTLTDSSAPVAADYTHIGSNLGNVATKPGYLTLLNSVIDPLTAQKIDTPAEITALADKVSKVLGYAGSTSTNPATPAPVAPRHDDFTGLGITGLEAADLPAVLARLSRIDNIETAGITRLAGLQEMVTKAVQAQAKVRNYADSNAPADAPTQQDYLDMGVPMPIRSEINDYAALMLGALNSTLAAPLVTRAQANTPQQLEAILALYHGKLLPMADGHSNTTPDKLLTVADLDLLGVNTTQLQLTETKHLRLFNDMVDNMPDAASVANVSHLNVLAARAAKVIAIADQAPGDLVADANKFSVEDYRYFLGQNAALQPLDEVAITYALQSKTSSDVLAVQTTKGLMVQAPLAYAKIRNYADGVGAAPVPTGEDYRILGISDVREVVVTSKPANLAALHAVLELPAINAISINPPLKLQAIVNSYNKLLAQANGTPADTADDNLAGLQDFKNIGINMVRLEAMSSEQSGNAIKLLSSIIDSRGAADIDTPAKIQNFVTLAEKVALLVKGDRSQPLSVADFTALNIPGVKDSNIEQVRNKIDGLRDDGLDSNTWSKLADAVFTVTNVPSLNPVTADNIINKAEREAGVTLTGTAGRDDTVTLRFEDGSVMKSGIVTVDSHNGTNLWNWSYTLTEVDWTKLGAAGANNVKKSIRLQSHNTIRNTDSIEVNGEFFIDTVVPGFSSPIRLEVDSGDAGDRITNNGKIIVPVPEAGVNWSYQIDSDNVQNGSGNSFVVPEGQHTVTVRQTDGAGNSTNETLMVTVDTIAPTKSTVALKDDTGDLPNDFITRTGVVKVTGLEPGVKWQHRSGITGAWIDHGPAGTADTEHIVDLSAGADGERRIQVRQIDAADNKGQISDELVFTLDRTSPALTLQLAQDTGTAGDGITYNGTVQVNGLEAGRAWTYQIDGGDWIEVSGSAGLNTVVVPGQKTRGMDGLRKVRVKQSDAAGNETVSSELSFTLDTIDPVFTTDIRLQQDTGTSGIDGITSNGRIIVPAPEAGATWSYRIDNGSFQNGGSSNSFEVPEGRHDVTVRMTDVAGNIKEQTKNVTLDTRPPAAPTLTLVDDTGAPGNNDRITSNGNVRVTGLEPRATWKYKIGASTYLPGSDTNIIDAAASSDGQRQVSVIQIDEAGNESLAGELTFTLDRIGPSLVLSLLNKTGSTAAAITRDGTVKVDGLEPGRAWQYQIGDGAWVTGSGNTVAVPGANASGGSDGVKEVRVRQTDVAGNESITPQFEFTLDTTAPAKPVLALVRDTAGVAGSSVITLDTDKITSDGRVRISNVEAGSKVEYSINNTDWLVLTGDTLTLTGDGSKQVWMRQTDVAGNVSTVSDRFDFTLDTVATKPSVRLVNDTGDTRLPGVATDKLTRDGTVEVLGLEPGATWQYKLDDGNWQNGSSTTTFTLGGSEGTKRIVVRQTDKAGNASAESEALEFILDRIAPVAPTLSKVAAVLSGGKTYSKDRSFTVSGLDADGLAEYRLGDGAWVRLTGNSFTLPATQADGEYRVAVRQSDKAGNVSPNAEVTFTLDTTAPTRAVLSNDGIRTFAGDSGRYSKDLKINVTGLDNSATKREYEIGANGSWIEFSGDSFNVTGNDGEKSVVVRQTDAAGNESLSTPFRFTLDTTPPTARPEVTLEKDTGRDAHDKNTNNGKVKISITNLEAGGSWEWSSDNGANWTGGPALINNRAEISLTGDGRKLFKVRVLDRLGNPSDAIKVTDNSGTLIDANVLGFTLDTTVNHPTFALTGQDRGAAKFTYSGTDAEANATITLKSGTLTLGTTTASATGAWSMEVRGTLRVSGLFQADGRSSNANGIYTLVTTAEAVRLSNTNAFSNDFVTTGTPLLNINREVYSMTRDGQTWYVWAPLNGDFIISRTTGSDEWYEGSRFTAAIPSTTILYADKATNWKANSGRASDLLAQQLINNGMTVNSRRLEGVDVYRALGNQNDGTVYAQQTDVAGNITSDKDAVTSAAPMSGTLVIAGVDLDDLKEGVQTSASRIVGTSTMALGILGVGTAFAPAAKAYTPSPANIIKVNFGGSGLDVVNDKLLLHSEMALNHSWSASGVSFGTATNLIVRYGADTRTLYIANATGAAFASNDVLDRIIRSIRLKNVFAAPGDRTMTVSLADASDIDSLPATATLSVSNDALWIDLDPVTAGTQFSSTRYVTRASDLVSGEAFDNQIAAPTATNIRGLKVRLSGAGLDIANDKLKLDVALNLANSLPTAIGKTIGGVSGLSYVYDAPTRTLNIGKTQGTALTGAEVKAIVESLVLSNSAARDGERVAELTLLEAGAIEGITSTARLILDTKAPTVDMDDSTGGIQLYATTIVNATSMEAGIAPYSKNVAVATASDIQEIILSYIGPAAARPAESLFTIPLGTNSSGTLTVSGISQLSYALTTAALTTARAREHLILRKSSGEAFNNIETKAILDAVRFKSTSTDYSDRQLELYLLDTARNSGSMPAISTFRINNRTAPTLEARKVDTGNQISFGMLTLGEGLRDSSNSTRNSVSLPLPAGFTADTFLTALKGIASDWGGASITGAANSYDSKYRSYTTLDRAPLVGSEFKVAHQSHSFIKGADVKFTNENGVLKLYHQRTFSADADMFLFNGPATAFTSGAGSYDMGNIRLLYQTTSANGDSTPTIAITYDRAKAVVGDVIALYEGNKVLASKTLDSTDAGGTGNATLNLKVNTSLAKGEHVIVSKYTSTTGATSTATALTVNVSAEMKVPLLTDLKVKASYDADAKAKAVLLGGDSYTSITDPGISPTAGVYDKGLIFTGRINTEGLDGKQKYLVSISMGGKTLGFDIFELESTSDPRTSSFSLQAASNVLAPGVYRDLSVTVTNVTEGSIYNGQTSAIKDAALGWFWATKIMRDIRGGNGDDGIILSPTPTGTTPTVTTGAGADTLILGSFQTPDANSSASPPTNWLNFNATVTDFQLGLDKVQVAGQTITAANLNSFLRSIAATPDRGSTILTVDTDGAGAKQHTYTLTLNNVRYDPANTQTIFGI